MRLIRLLDKMQLDKNGKYTCVKGEEHGSSHAFMDANKVEVTFAEIKDHTGKKRKTMIATLNDIVEFSHYRLNDKNCELTKEHATLVLNPVCKGAVYEINRQVEITSESAWNEEIAPVVD